MHTSSTVESRLDRQLLVAAMLGPLAIGLNTIVGYTVAHWVCDVHRKTTGFAVSAVDFALCLLAALLAWNVQRRLPAADETQPELGRRRFMAKMGLVLATFAFLVVLAGTLAMVTLHPCD